MVLAQRSENSKETHAGPAYARDPNGNLMYGTNSQTTEWPKEERYKDVPQVGWCMVTRSFCLTSNPDQRWEDFQAVQLGSRSKGLSIPAREWFHFDHQEWPEVKVMPPETPQPPEPQQRTLSEPGEKLSIYDAIRQKDGSYKVSGAGNT
jgi:hypothetical protein